MVFWGAILETKLVAILGPTCFRTQATARFLKNCVCDHSAVSLIIQHADGVDRRRLAAHAHRLIDTIEQKNLKLSDPVSRWLIEVLRV